MGRKSDLGEWVGATLARFLRSAALGAMPAGGIALVLGLAWEPAAGLWVVATWVHWIARGRGNDA